MINEFVPPGWSKTYEGVVMKKPNDLIKFFDSVPEKPLTPYEFMAFWNSLTWDEMNYFTFCNLE